MELLTVVKMHLIDDKEYIYSGKEIRNAIKSGLEYKVVYEKDGKEIHSTLSELLGKWIISKDRTFKCKVT